MPVSATCNGGRREGRLIQFGLSLAAAALLEACAIRRDIPVSAPPPAPAPSPAPTLLDFEATAYSIEGHTKSGEYVRRGVVAADPKVLPIGSRIRIHEAGPYSGTYEVLDTGRAIKGREVDIYIANDEEAKQFGRRNVKVEILDNDQKQ